MTRSLQQRARRAGMLYASGGVIAPLVLLYVPSVLLVSGDAAATAARVAQSSVLIRMAIAGEFLHCILSMIGVLELYRLFRDVSRPLTTLMVALFLAAIPIELAGLGHYAAALMLASGASWLRAISREQLNALVYLFVRLHANGLQLAQLFWGAWLFPYGLVAMRSGFIPRGIGAALVAAGVGFATASALALCAPAYLATIGPVARLLMMGELPMIVWLIGWGVRPRPAMAMD